MRIAVNNLAGVPSIVFGVFGLGFFVYFVGGAIDQAFFPERLPTPTFGTGGILWASLTLGLLTVPVVIVASEEALAAVPRSMREASLATGATKFQTILRVVLPAAAPGILTGLILAMARGAGEVAPLMITGVVKLAPDLPLDGIFPFLHLERKFMHLGFHIYDVGFQSPNVEAAKPMVYATADPAAADRRAAQPHGDRRAQPAAAAVPARRRSRQRHGHDHACPRPRLLRTPTSTSRAPPPASAAPTAVSIRHANLWYGEKQALHDISLDMPAQPGHRVHRPVRLRQVDAAALPQPDERPDRRRPHHRRRSCVDGQDIYAPSTDVIDVRRRIGMVFQKSNPLPKSIYENVVYGLRIAGIRDKATLDEACERACAARRSGTRSRTGCTRAACRSRAASSSGCASRARSRSSRRSS